MGNETKHTKGEWEVNLNGIYQKGTSKGIATCLKQSSDLDSSGMYKQDFEMEANAQLIVKAVNCHHELVEALKGLYNAIDSSTDLTPELLKKCNTALKKATTD